ncbi:hypothetical protein SPRG_04265 [Saprolegnia parasitica CBS 223.65]|uniref:Uncharacterized protein n=1 Tax=Saprolegnia parasitica (strain CBS 223.65) TaxID=695850 RepID=A0A067CX79_SAPPC|nr:hypothetical protein SPRG_04265 [Saprolegnia parasitica CBS 223.65]KDO31126.1 hypothetical protein SPRG_04265 [Saprolegnia parasitica CBS 223.65]|eukprot:XP_012198255.1 hypothetical protein SPRG_04265 [Saprolegnia parasitica CBS 223.65]
MGTTTLARATAEVAADLRTKEEALHALEEQLVRLQLRVLRLKPPLVHLQCQLSSSSATP